MTSMADAARIIPKTQGIVSGLILRIPDGFAAEYFMDAGRLRAEEVIQIRTMPEVRKAAEAADAGADKKY